MKELVEKVEKELDVSTACAMDVAYLRTRSRWSEDLENKLIKLHKNGNPPENMSEFGVTEETQRELWKKAVNQADIPESKKRELLMK